MPHQESSVRQVRELLGKRGGALLADAPGSGKSWIAAAIAKEYAERGMSIDLVIPANLRKDWQLLALQFGFEPRILEHASIFRMHLLPEAQRTRLVIVDEAHQFRTATTRRFAALAQLCVAQDVLLVTATPLWNSMSEVAALVSLIAEDDAFRASGVFSLEAAMRADDRAALGRAIREVIVRSQTSGSGGHVPPLKRRVVSFETKQIDTVVHLVQSLEFPPFVDHARELLREFLLLRLTSGEAAFRSALSRQTRFCERAIEVAARGESLTRQDFHRHFARETVQAGTQQLLFPQLFGTGAGDSDLLPALQRELEKIDRLSRVTLGSEKLTKLREIVVRSGAMNWIIFTTSIATAHELARSLAPAPVAIVASSEERSGDGSTRMRSLESFARGDLKVLITTDWSSEGLNLQRADAVVHYDLPWNPARLQQRVARACRVGRSSVVEEWFFLPKDDQLRRLFKTIRRKRRLVESLFRSSQPCTSLVRLDGVSIPSLLARRSSQSALARRLDALHRLDARWLSLLMRRYRCGAERLIGQVSEEYVDASRLEELAAVLDAEIAVRQRPGGATPE